MNSDPEDQYKNDLVGDFNPSEKHESIGMIVPNIWKSKRLVPNHHQPVMDYEVDHSFQTEQIPF